MAVWVLGACSEMPESLNPVLLFRGDSAAPPPPGADQAFPNLASVPETPRKGSSSAEIEEIREGLVADRERARYTDQELRSSATDDVDFAESMKAAAGSRRPLAAEASAAAEAEDIELARAVKARADALAASSTAVPKTATPGKQAAADTPANAVLRFASGSTELSNEAIERLGQLVVRYGEVGGTLRVIGHAPPPTNNGADGQALAYDRALVVAAELKRLGIPAERMRVITDDASAGAADDRVDVVIEP